MHVEIPDAVPVLAYCSHRNAPRMVPTTTNNAVSERIGTGLPSMQAFSRTCSAKSRPRLMSSSSIVPAKACSSWLSVAVVSKYSPLDGLVVDLGECPEGVAAIDKG